MQHSNIIDMLFSPVLLYKNYSFHEFVISHFLQTRYDFRISFNLSCCARLADQFPVELSHRISCSQRGNTTGENAGKEEPPALIEPVVAQYSSQGMFDSCVIVTDMNIVLFDLQKDRV